MQNNWFAIVNPNAGLHNFSKIWKLITDELDLQKISYIHRFTEFPKHEKDLVSKALSQGYRKFIVVGGDGTLHHVINGLLEKEKIATQEITIAVIPTGTGNDWIKTYAIPKNIKQNIQLIKNQNTKHQDIGCIQLENQTNYFVNVAGIGYDGYVVHKLKKLKKLGQIAYLISGIQGMLSYKKSKYLVTINHKTYSIKALMLIFGIGKYSGGGMQLTKFSDPLDSKLDITVAKNLHLFDLLRNVKKLYTGTIVNHAKVDTYHQESLEIKIQSKHNLPYIQADGELIGTGNLKISIIPKAIKFIVPEAYNKKS